MQYEEVGGGGGSEKVWDGAVPIEMDTGQFEMVQYWTVRPGSSLTIRIQLDWGLFGTVN